MLRFLGRTISLILVTTAFLLLVPTSASAAIKLVRMHNGRTLKAQTVERDGDWILTTLDGGSTVGFLATEVESVEDDPLGREETGGPTNVVTSGREVGRSSFRANNSRQQAIAQPPQGQAADQEQQEMVQPEEDPNPAVINTNIQQQTPAEAAQQPPGSRFNRLGLRARNGDN